MDHVRLLNICRSAHHTLLAILVFATLAPTARCTRIVIAEQEVEELTYLRDQNKALIKLVAELKAET
jgi:hypothetical protein